MTPRADGVVGFENRALFVNKVTDTLGESSFHVVTRTVGETHCAVSIAEEKEGKTILLRERGILGNRVKADSEHFYIARAKLFDLVAEPAAFRCSARGVSFWIKPQQHFFSAEIREREGFAFMRLYCEMWSWCTDG